MPCTKKPLFEQKIVREPMESNTLSTHCKAIAFPERLSAKFHFDADYSTLKLFYGSVKAKWLMNEDYQYLHIRATITD